MTALRRSGAGRTGEAAQAALDVMLTEAAVAGPSRVPRPGVAARFATGLARHPGRTVGRAWLAERSGELKHAPKRLGGRARKALAKAPGNYVHAG